MLKLQHVSKYYYNKGMITSGLSNINLELNCGEFVAVTGESGSGKSTLLNVIAGLDSYEDGEMYVNGQETSHFSQNDLENYRKSYVGNIFQNFNLINSYSVYKNVELALLLNNYNKKTKKQRILDVIKLVGLTKWRNTKVAKLSGGQKQRVAIARVLVRNTPIILADEPTGNLDQQSAQEILRLLSAIAVDKLVVIVTHEYAMVEPYVTRKIVLSDGSILEDQIIRSAKIVENRKVVKPCQIKLFDKFRLGLRNTFNLVIKFMLLLSVFIVLVWGVSSQYATFRYQKDANDSYGYNSFFQDVSDKRIVVNKKDRSQFTAEELAKIALIEGVEKIVENDMILDIWADVNNEDNIYVGGRLRELSQFTGELDYGNLPQQEDELIIALSEWDYYANDPEALLNQTVNLNVWQFGGPQFSLRITGIVVVKNYQDMAIYINENQMKRLGAKVNIAASKIETTLNKQIFTSEYANPYYGLYASEKVPVGQVFVSSDMNFNCKNMKCRGSTINSKVSNLYYQASFTGKITKVIKLKNLQKEFDLGFNWRDYSYTFFINPADYDALFLRPSYQLSIYLRDAKDAKVVCQQLDDLGANPLYIKDTLYNEMYNVSFVLKIWNTLVLGFVVIALFLISYFIIQLILRSRQSYYSIVRILGGSKAVVKDLVTIELFTVSLLAFVIVFALRFATTINFDKFPYFAEALQYVSMVFNDSMKYITMLDYGIIYVVLLVMTYWLAYRVASNLFIKSAAQTYREGARG